MGVGRLYTEGEGRQGMDCREGMGTILGEAIADPVLLLEGRVLYWAESG